MKKEEHERRNVSILFQHMVFARQEAAKAWCGEKTSDKTMDAELAEEFAKIIVKHMYEPHLGCATTRELLTEIQARIEVDGKLDYKTIGHD